MPQKLLLVDCPNQVFRAYHGLQTDMRAPDGFPTRALFGFTRILRALVRDHAPDFVACVFDRGADARLALWPEYKGTRPDMPDDLRQQWPEFEPLCRAFGYRVLAVEGAEADDIIGTLATRFAGPELDVQIVSGDKDFCQLVNDHVQVLDVQKGVVMDRAGVVEKWGVGPEKIVELLALMGDTSDNVPGVPGVGPKKAAQYVEKFGSAEGVLANWAAIGGKTGEAVRDAAPAVHLAKRLVAIDTGMELGVRLEDLRPVEPDADFLRERLLRYNFRTLWEEMGLGSRPTVVRAAATANEVRVVWGPGLLAALHGELRGRRVAMHLDVAGRTPLRLRLAWDAERVLVPLDARALEQVRPILADPEIRKTGHDLKTMRAVLRESGAGLLGIDGDVMLLDYLVVPEQKHHLDHITKRWLEEPAGPDAAGQVLRIEAALAEATAPMRRVYAELDLPLIPILGDMEAAGIGVDVGALGALSAELEGRLEAEKRQIWALAGEEFNINSTQQLAVLLYEKMGLAAGKKTKTGRSTDADTLEKLDVPITRAILAYRELYKLKNTYVDALPRCVAADGRIHTTYSQAVAATGRLSSNDPNLQNIPVRTDDGRRIRSCFLAKEGHVFLSADYSQIELRVLAHYCGDGPLAESFRDGEDIHRRTASEIFGVAPALVSTSMRRAAKAINFGIVYGMGAFRLASDLGIPRAEAQRYIDGYFARYPQVRLYMQSAMARARELGYAETLHGRRRPVEGLDAPSQVDRAAAERIAINSPIQGSAADLIKLAMIRVDAAIRGTGARLLLQVHDELVLEVPEGEAAEVGAAVKAAMEGAASLSVPVVADVGQGRSWAEAH
jgi:DNA polymerase-1